MTDYGRGPGSEPWHPEDPLYGDQGWAAQQATDGSAPYAGQPQQQYAQQPHSQGQAQYGGGQDPYQQQYHPQQQGGQPHYVAQQPQYDGQQYHNPQYGDPQQSHQAQQYGGQQQQPQPHQQQQHPQQHPQPQYNDPQYNGSWDNGQQATMPYGGQPGTSYDAQQLAGYGDNQDYYATPDAYPPPQPPAQRRAEPEPAPDQGNGWEDEQQKETHPFFTGDGDDGDAEPGEGRRGGGGRDRRGKTKKKGRNGVACMVVAVVLVGGVGGVGYVGYQYWQQKFGPPPDFVGTGSGTVEVEIPQGAGGYEIAALLVKKGVVKSQRAFVSAQQANPKGNTIQAGVYRLSKKMSAANAVKTMLSPSSRNALVIPEGRRNVWVYEEIDKRLELKKGETAAVAKAEAKNLGLPKWANDNREIKDPLEGFLFPASYPVAKGMKPEAVLKKMVARANAEYGKQDLKAEAEKLGLKSPLQLIAVASLVQAEGKYKHDFDKVSRVVYNRLQPDNTETVGRLEFDSTVNYIKSQSRLDLGAVDNLRKIKDPYNTYDIKGLPPGPIGNPGADALNSAINPAEGPWYYFVSVTSDKTLFAVTNEEHEENRQQYEKENKKP
ncbi:endolytic transglycosylase MltG [Streptomyces scopuliridis]|uniref:endolytic transglycosylase MltG n=1 Tax=Streptomyces scopuliridis TaxID=452529 RepID=UPI0004C27B5A|nr:endolytic transglycosylase MltG [Streptomyces scopuliridis]